MCAWLCYLLRDFVICRVTLLFVAWLCCWLYDYVVCCVSLLFVVWLCYLLFVTSRNNQSILDHLTCIIKTTVLHTINAKMRYSNACDVTTRHIWNWRRLLGMYRLKGLALRANSIHWRWWGKRQKFQNTALYSNWHTSAFLIGWELLMTKYRPIK